MAITRLPLTPKLPFYDFDVELDDVIYRLEFRYNGRDSAWYMKISDLEDNILRSSIKIVNEWLLLRSWVTQEAPKGEISVISQGNDVTAPGLDDLGVDIILHYLDADELGR